MIKIKVVHVDELYNFYVYNCLYIYFFIYRIIQNIIFVHIHNCFYITFILVTIVLYIHNCFYNTELTI